MEVPMSQKSTAKPGPLKRWGPLGVLLGLIGLAFAMGWHEQLSLSNLIKHREELHAYVGNNFWFSILSYVAIYIVATALLFPAASLITIAGGLVFGSVLATSLTLSWRNHRCNYSVSCCAYLLWFSLVGKGRAILGQAGRWI